MTFKQYAESQSHLPLGTIRANWGKITQAVQSDLATRHGGGKGGTYKLTGKVNSDGLVRVSHTRVVQATAAEIRAQRQAASEASARADGKLAELEALASEEGRKGLDLVELVKAKTDTKPASQTAPASK